MGKTKTLIKAKKMKKRFRGQKQIIIVVDQAARDNCGPFVDIRNCPIATAIKQQYNIKDALVSPDDVKINDFYYDILGDNGSAHFVDEAMQFNKNLALVLNRR